jgi:pSer/pThr/pTyr-binding forkhead associated (FHA) protein
MSLRFSCVDAVSTVGDLYFQSLPITIGRGEDADICINDSWASRFNCRLDQRDGQLWVQDLESSNGTRLNGESIDEKLVSSGDELTIGITTFRVTFSRLPAGNQNQVAGLA